VPRPHGGAQAPLDRGEAACHCIDEPCGSTRNLRKPYNRAWPDASTLAGYADAGRQCRERGLRLGELGRAAGLSHGFLSQIEHGKVLPSLSSLFDIAAALKVPAADLLALEG
jgi:DNA-binding XRE family transcriptional regulator